MRTKQQSLSQLLSITETVILQFKRNFSRPVQRIWGYFYWFAVVTIVYVGCKAAWPTIEAWLPNTSFRGFFLPWVTAVLVYTGMLLLYYVIYHVEHPFFEQYKINDLDWPWYSDPNWSKKCKEALLVTLKNNFIWAPLFSGFLAYGGLGKGLCSTADIPEYHVFLAQVLFFIMVEELAFYTVHRIIHLPCLYSKIHKVHHEFYDTISLATEYAHPVEFILGNMIPVGLGPMLMFRRFHYVSLIAFITVRLMFSVENHSGYEFPWALTRPLPFEATGDYHNHHHLKNSGNFCSSSIVWDSIFGTNQVYFADKKRAMEQKRQAKGSDY